jgi:Fur family ferric uptake transcriptional regulator
MKRSRRHSDSLGRASALLRDHGLKKTRPRIDVLSLLLSARKPLSHHEIAGAIPGADKVTVYRVLSSLLDSSIAHRIETGDRVWQFAVCPCGHTEHCHPHFSCRKCGKMECLSDVKLPRWNRLKPGRVVENQEIYLHGLCASCRQEGA